MAIRRVDPNATFKIISQLDDAIEHETADEMEALKTDQKDVEGNTILRPTRYEDYLDSLDESKLKFKEGGKPTRFVVRCLRNAEVAQLNERFLKIDPVAKTIDYSNRNALFLEHFKLGCLGIEEETEDGAASKLVKVTVDELGFGVAVGMGSVISLLTSLGKNLKK